jgi:hypothetical protein
VATGSQPAAPVVTPGTLFNVPLANESPTQYYDAVDTTEDLTVSMPTQSETPVNGIQPLSQTDVVLDVEVEIAVSQSYTAGTGQTLTASPWAPFNAVRNIKMPLQNVYSSVELSNGIYLAFFNALRPLRHTNRRLNLFANPAGYAMASGLVFGYQNSAGAQPPLQVSGPWTTSTSSYNLLLRIPVGIWFDEYWPLNALGLPLVTAADGQQSLATPVSTFVSPLYMASANKIVQPQFSFSAPFGQADVSPVYTTTNSASGDTASTFSGSASITVRRFAVRGAPPFLPPPHAWLYQLKENAQTIGSTQRFTFNHQPEDGQILSSTLVLFDPAANGGIGAPIPLSQVEKVTFTYGSGVIAFQGSPQTLQRRFLEKHGFLPPPGFLPLDWAVDERGRVTNRVSASQFDTYNTTGIGWRVELSSAPSQQTTATLLTESLRLVQ